MLYYIRVQFFYQEGAFVDYLHHLDGSVGLYGIAVGQGLVFPDRFVDGDLHLALAFAFAGDGKIHPAGAAHGLFVHVDGAALLHLRKQLEKIHYDSDQRNAHQGGDDDEERLRLHTVFQQDGCPAETQDEVDEIAEGVKIDSAPEIAPKIGGVKVEIGGIVDIRTDEGKYALDDEHQRSGQSHTPEDFAQNTKRRPPDCHILYKN